MAGASRLKPIPLEGSATVAGAAALLQRPLDDILFWRPGQAVPCVTGAAFLRAAARVAAALPPARAYLNLCRDPSGTALALAASMLRSTPCVLVTDPSPAGITALMAQFPGAHALRDENAEHAASFPPASAVAVQPADVSGPPPINPVFPPAQIALVGVTSGSSGTPTSHAKSWGAIEARNRSAARRFGLRGAAQRPLVGTVSPTHMYGMETMVLLPLHASVITWCAPAFFPGDAAASLGGAAGLHTTPGVDAGRVAPEPVFITTPLNLAALLQSGAPLPALHAVISATAPLDTELALRAETLWHCPVLEIFGATEVGSIASRRTARDEGWTLYDNVALRPGEGVTEVEAEGAPATRLSDVLDLMPDGGFRLVARSSDIVKRGGRRASLAGLTRILAGLEGVTDAAFVMPDPSPRRGGTERPLAFAVAPGRDAASLREELRQRIEPAFLPRRIQLLDRLPRNEIGKLPRDALLALAAKAEGS